ncbi:vp80 [Erannis ankeraria nucleopolyhedrovirus]|uniref:vp80 n=1 Tax=Erannis ankeraria nucleopolyhedrovirus TaxID=2913600 RepID=UPI0011799FA7|nr:vp80 [Erannis ankeraria nucleopolyhedrovirus]UJZ89004.1 vp80 [Erannis ankeraria nucleopolyhedrovirus]
MEAAIDVQDFERIEVDGVSVPFKCRRIIGDGACVFRSLSYILYGTEDNHFMVRKNVVDFIVNNWSEYQPFLTASEGGADPVNYQSHMLRPNSFASSVEIEAAAKLYNIHINMYKEGKLIYSVGEEQNIKKYFKFSGNLGSGHVDVYELLYNKQTFQINNHNISFEYIKILYEILQKHYNQNTNETKQNTIQNEIIKLLQRAEDTWNDQTSSIEIKNVVFSNVIYGLQTIYNDLHADKQLLYILDDKFSTQDDFDIILDELPVNSVIKKENDNTIEVTENDNSEYNESGKYFTVAKIYLKIDRKDLTSFKVDLNEIKASSFLNDYSKMNINKLQNEADTFSSNYSSATLLLNARDVFKYEFLNKFINKHKDYTKYKTMSDDLYSKLTELQNVSKSDIETQPLTVRIALQDLSHITKYQTYYLIVTILENDFNNITRNDLKALLELYNDFEPINFVLTSAVDINNIYTVADYQEYRTRMKPRNIYNYETDDDEENGLATLKRKPYSQKYRSMKRSKKITENDAIKQTSDIVNEQISNGVNEQTSSVVYVNNDTSTVSMPRLLIGIVTTIPSVVDESYLTCPTTNLQSVPNAHNYRNSLRRIAELNLSILNQDVHFYDLLLPLIYYGSNELYKNQIIWFISNAQKYYLKCANDYELIIKDIKDQPKRDHIFIFIIQYNFLWHYKQFIRTLPSTSLTLFFNQTILNALSIYSKIVQNKFNSLPLTFTYETLSTANPYNKVIKLMIGDFEDNPL